MKNMFDTIKERLLGYKSELDLDREWAALNQRQAKKHQQGSSNRFSILLLLLLFVGSCSSLLWLKMRPVKVAQVPARNNMAQKPDSNAGNTSVSPTPVVTATQTSAYAADSAPDTNQMTSGIATRSTLENTQLVPNTPERIHQVNTPLVAKTYWIADQVNNNATVIHPAAINTPEAPFSKTDTPSKVDTTQVINALAKSDGTQTTVTLANTTSATSAIPVSNSRTDDNISLLSARGITVPAMAVGVAPTLPTPYLTLTQEPTFVTKKQSFSAISAVFVGSGWLGSQQRFRVAEGQAEQYAALRQSTETALPSFTFNVGVQRTLGKRGFIEASLHYNQWYERLNYTFEQPKNYTLTNVLLNVTRIDGFGSEVRTYGDTVINGTQTVSIINYNQYASINLRLILGQQLVQAGRFAFSAGAGVDGSIWSRAKGIIADPDPTVGTVNLKDVYKSSFGLGISAVTRFEYQLRPKYALHLTPGAVWWVGNNLNTNGQLEARWRQISITAGLIHWL
jgi:hypothetical protein